MDPGTSLPVSGYTPSPLLLSITEPNDKGKPDFGDLTDAEIIELDNNLNLINTNSFAMAKLIQELQEHKISWNKTYDSSSTWNARYVPTNRKKMLLFNFSQGRPMAPHTLIEELIHVFQHKFYGNNFKNIPLSNIEFEAKLMRDLIARNFRWQNLNDPQHHQLSNAIFDRDFLAIQDMKYESDYDKYMEKITKNFKSLPKNINDLKAKIEGKIVTYWTMMEHFRNFWRDINPNYAIEPDTTQNPNAMFYIFTNCNCYYRTL